MRPGVIEYLRGHEPGRLRETAELERHLAESWATFEGNDSEGMTAEKLPGRMEQVEWTPPVLNFVIERHGGACLGSSRAPQHRPRVGAYEPIRFGHGTTPFPAHDNRNLVVAFQQSSTVYAALVHTHFISGLARRRLKSLTTSCAVA